MTADYRHSRNTQPNTNIAHLLARRMQYFGFGKTNENRKWSGQEGERERECEKAKETLFHALKHKNHLINCHQSCQNGGWQNYRFEHRRAQSTHNTTSWWILHIPSPHTPNISIDHTGFFAAAAPLWCVCVCVSCCCCFSFVSFGPGMLSCLFAIRLFGFYTCYCYLQPTQQNLVNLLGKKFHSHFAAYFCFDASNHLLFLAQQNSSQVKTTVEFEGKRKEHTHTQSPNGKKCSQAKKEWRKERLRNSTMRMGNARSPRMKKTTGVCADSRIYSFSVAISPVLLYIGKKA